MKNDFIFTLSLTILSISCTNTKVKNIELNCINITNDSSLNKNQSRKLKIKINSNIDLKKFLNTQEFQSIFYFSPTINYDSFNHWRKHGNDKLKNVNYFELVFSNTNIVESVIDSNKYIYQTDLNYLRGFDYLPVDSAISALNLFFSQHKVLQFQGYWTPFFLKGLNKRTNMNDFFVKKENLSL